jgi:copper chaperone NosL
MAFRTHARRIASLVAVPVAVACSSPGPRPLAFGAEECSHCHMTLSDPRFAGQLVTTTGKVVPFDDVGCLATFVVTGGVAADRIHSLWVHDYSRPDSLLDVATVVFLQHDSIRTPMDYGLIALRKGGAADSLRARLGGRLLSWADVLGMIEARQGR